jgi:m7GpppX diphosphatase
MFNKNLSVLEIIFTNPKLKILEILDSNYDRCFFSILGKIFNEEKKSEENFVLKIKKKEFLYTPENICEVSKNIQGMIKDPEEIFNNDIYYKLLSSDYVNNKLKLDLIYPADSKVIDKYRKKGYNLFVETSEIYYEKTKKFIDSIDSSHTKWIYNLLHKKTEKILHEEENLFVIVQDYNSKDNPEILNCLALPYQDNLKCLRDLSEDNLELLEKFYYKGREALAKQFDVPVDKIRSFIHYPPTFYYLHVHYLHVDFESSSTSVNRAYDLFTIIQNIKTKKDYYQTTPFEYTLQTDSALYNILLKK